MRAMVVWTYFLFAVVVSVCWGKSRAVFPDATRLFRRGATDKAESRRWYLTVSAEHIV
jgi:hypothetical protein